METPTIRPTAASQPGALACFTAICPLCGMELKSSLLTIAQDDVRKHAEYHARSVTFRMGVQLLEGPR